MEQVALEARQMATFLADHLVEAAMQLDRAGPWGFGIERDLRRQRWHGSLDTIDVLGVESDQSVILGKPGEHVMEGSW